MNEQRATGAKLNYSLSRVLTFSTHVMYRINKYLYQRIL